MKQEVVGMPWRREERVRVQCDPSGRSVALRAAGAVLIVAGVVLILLCVPGWAWLAAIGAALGLLGLLLIRK